MATGEDQTFLLKLGVRCWINANFQSADRRGVLRLNQEGSNFIRAFQDIVNVSTGRLLEWGLDARARGTYSIEDTYTYWKQTSSSGDYCKILPDWSEGWSEIDGTVQIDDGYRNLCTSISVRDNSKVVERIIDVGISLNWARVRLDQAQTDLEPLSACLFAYRNILLSNWGFLEQEERDRLSEELHGAVLFDQQFDVLSDRRLDSSGRPSLVWHDFQRVLDACSTGLRQVSWTEGEKLRCGTIDLGGIVNISTRNSVTIGPETLRDSRDLGHYLSVYYFKFRPVAGQYPNARCVNGEERKHCRGDHYQEHVLLDRIPPILIVHFEQACQLDIPEARARHLLSDWEVQMNTSDDAPIIRFRHEHVFYWSDDLQYLMTIIYRAQELRNPTVESVSAHVPHRISEDDDETTRQVVDLADTVLMDTTQTATVSMDTVQMDTTQMDATQMDATQMDTTPIVTTVSQGNASNENEIQHTDTMSTQVQNEGVLEE